MVNFPGGKGLAVCVMIMLLQSVNAKAQQHYNLQQLVAASQHYFPLLKQKQALLGGARAVITDVRHSFLPQLRGSEQLTFASDNSLAGSYFTYGITPSTSAGVRASNTLEPATGNLAVVYGEYELYNFGLNNARLNYANALADLQTADLEKDQYNLQLELGRLYFSLLRYQYRLRADSQNVDRYEHIATIIRALTMSGLRAGVDSSLAKAELARTRISYNQTAGKIAQLRVQLSFLTGIDAQQLLLDTLSSTAMPVSTAVGMPDTANNPLLRYYQQKKMIGRYTEQLIRKTYQPKILLSGATWARGSSIQYNDQFKSLATGLAYQRFNYALGVSFSYNLFNGLYKKDKLAINRFQQQALDAEYEQQKLALITAQQQSAIALNTLHANLGEITVQTQSAQDTYQQKLAQYRAGIISLIDLTNASFVLYRSQTDYIEALNDWYTSLLEQAAAEGRLLLFIQSLK